MAYSSIHDDHVHSQTVERIQRLSPESERQWGVMDHDQLLPHLVDGMRLALEGTGRRAKGLVATALMRHLIIHRLSWPEGKASAPRGAFQRTCENWDEDRDELLGLIERYRSTPPDDVGNAHPIFGPMKNQEESIRAQQEAIRFQKVTTRRVMLGLVPLIAIVLGILLWLILAWR